MRTADPAVARLRADVLAKMGGLRVVKVKVYNLQGTAVFSTDPRQIGQDKSGNAGFRNARDGIVASDITYRDRFDAFEGVISGRNLIYSYIPVRQAASAPVEGVFEVYSDVTGLVAEQKVARAQIAAILLAALVCLYLFACRRRPASTACPWREGFHATGAFVTRGCLTQARRACLMRCAYRSRGRGSRQGSRRHPGSSRSIADMDTRRTLVAAAISLASLAASAQVTGGLGSVGSSFLSLSGVNITGGAIYGPNDNVQTATRPANASPAIGTVGNWLAVGGTNVNNGGGTSATLRLASGITALSFLWGTPDSFNSVKVNTNAGSQTFTAATLGLTPTSNPNFAGYVNFRVSGGAASISSVEFISPSPAFEISNVSVVPEPGTAALLLGGLLAVGLVARRRRLQGGAQPAAAA